MLLLTTFFNIKTFAQSKEVSVKIADTKEKASGIKNLTPKYTQAYKILWTSPKQYEAEGTNFSFLNFEGASFSSLTNIPYYTSGAKLPSGYKNAQVILTNMVFAELNASESVIAEKIPNLGTSIIVNTQLVYTKKIPSLMYDFIPLRKNPNTGKIEKLVAFDISINPLQGNRSSGRSHTFAAESVLKSGTWFKVGVTKDGVYKIDFNYLKNLGAKPEEIDPRNLKVFGTGGEQLPFLTVLPVLTTLPSALFIVKVNQTEFLIKMIFYFFMGKVLIAGLTTTVV